MKMLDRFIARQFLFNAAALMLILFSFVVAIDVSINFDEFFRVASERVAQANALAGGDAGGNGGGDGGGGRGGVSDPSTPRVAVVAALLVCDLWWPKLLQLFNYMLGLVMIGAMGFTLSAMTRHRELVALLASGVSLFRVARPIVLAAGLLSLVQLVNQEFFLPRIAPLLTREHRHAGQRDLVAGQLRPVTDAAGRLLYAREFNPGAGTLEDLVVVERNERGLATHRVTATRARWDSGVWLLEGGLRASYAENAPPPEPVRILETDLDPTAINIRRYSGYSQSLSWSQIGDQIADTKARPGTMGERARERADQLERTRWGRLGVVACNLLGLVTCLPLFLRREPGPAITASLKAAPLAVLALLGGVLGTAAAIPGLPPELSVFVPALVLLPLAIAAATSVKT